MSKDVIQGSVPFFNNDEFETYSISPDGLEKWRDSAGNVIHFRDPTGFEYWQTFNFNNIKTSYRDSNKIESFYDDRGEMTYSKSSTGEEKWYENDKVIHVKFPTGNEYWFDSDGRTLLHDPKLSTNNDSIRIEDLKKMTMIELLNLLGKNEQN